VYRAIGEISRSRISASCYAEYTNAFTRVYINVIAVGSNSFFPPSSAFHFPPVWHDVTGSLRVEPSPAATYTIVSVAHLLTNATLTKRTLVRLCAINVLVDAHACKETGESAGFSPHLSTDNDARTQTQCRTPSAHGIEAASREARDLLIRLARGVTVIFIGQSRPDD